MKKIIVGAVCVILIIITVGFLSSFIISTIQLVTSYMKGGLTSYTCLAPMKDNSLGNLLTIFSHNALYAFIFLVAGSLFSIIYMSGNRRKIDHVYKPTYLLSKYFCITFSLLTIITIIIVISTFREECFSSFFGYVFDESTMYNLNDLSKTPFRFLVYFFVTLVFVIILPQIKGLKERIKD